MDESDFAAMLAGELGGRAWFDKDGDVWLEHFIVCEGGSIGYILSLFESNLWNLYPIRLFAENDNILLYIQECIGTIPMVNVGMIVTIIPSRLGSQPHL